MLNSFCVTTFYPVQHKRGVYNNVQVVSTSMPMTSLLYLLLINIYPRRRMIDSRKTTICLHQEADAYIYFVFRGENMLRIEK